MSPIKHIRKHLFGVSQAAFAEIAGTTQASVSRWEMGELTPGMAEMARIREAARCLGVPWEDRLFFEVPSPSESAA